MGTEPNTNALLSGWQRGEDRSRDRLIARLHPELAQIAAARLRGERNSSLSTHDLINDAVIRLIQIEPDELSDRAHVMALASRLGTIARYDLSPDYYNKLLQQLAAVSPAQVKALLAKELDPNNEIIVTMGDRPSLNKAFSDAGINDVKLVEPDYK